MLKRFNNWWKDWGQVIGFLLIIITLNGYFLVFEKEMYIHDEYVLGWLCLFVGGCTWYVWQMKKHGWRLPKDIRDTH